MFKIAICDETQTSLTELSNWLRELAEEISLEASVDVYRNCKSFYKAAIDEEYQLLIMETVIACNSGIELAQKLRQSGCVSEIIFYTSTSEFALDAYSVYPVGYILKPSTKKKFREIFRHVTEKYRKKPSVVLKTRDGDKVSINVERIWYVEVFRTELDVHCGEDVKVYVGSLADVYKQLSASQFYRSHRSYIVNLRYVSKMGKYSFTMLNGDKVAIAKNRYAEAKAKFDEFVGSV